MSNVICEIKNFAQQKTPMILMHIKKKTKYVLNFWREDNYQLTILNSWDDQNSIFKQNNTHAFYNNTLHNDNNDYYNYISTTYCISLLLNCDRKNNW
jgi:hypothetical protein